MGGYVAAWIGVCPVRRDAMTTSVASGFDGFRIRPLADTDRDAWLRMRLALWPDCLTPRQSEEMATILEDAERQAVFAAERDGRICGFVEVSIHPHALGCQTNPVGYVEGWWVDEDARRIGVGRALLDAAERWARSKGCREMASDCHDFNAVSLAAHLASGYREAGRLIHFAKSIDRGADPTVSR